MMKEAGVMSLSYILLIPFTVYTLRKYRTGAKIIQEPKGNPGVYSVSL